MSKRLIYLDYAAATPMDEQVLQAMQPYFSKQFYNPAANYGPARSVSDDLYRAKARIAHHLGSRPGEIIFTSGGSEANNLAIRGVAEQYPSGRILVSAIEHESILEPAGHCANHGFVPVDEQGIIRLARLKEQITDDTVLVSIMHANNEIGTIQPLPKIARIIQAIRTERRKKKNDLPLYFHTDAAQTSNYLDLHAHRLGVDMMTLNGGKMYGPKGIGVLFVHSNVRLKPQLLGGGQQRNLRSGTENVASAVGLATALDVAQALRKPETKRLAELSSHMIGQLRRIAPNIVVNGSEHMRLPNNVHLSFPGQDNERLIMLLEAQSIYAAAGSACSALSQAASHVLTAIGLDERTARSSLRFSLGRGTNRTDIERVVKVLARLA